ncbi:MAG: BsuPI-related putative proteinase inhibitor [Gemmatimonadales bacterium]
MLSGALLGDTLTFQVTAPDSVRAGEPVPIALRLANTSGRPLQLYLQGRPLAFDITIRGPDGTIVWRRLEGATVSAILAVRVLEPGASLTFEDTWDQASKHGAPIPPGEYTVTGSLPTDRDPLETPPTRLRIVP